MHRIFSFLAMFVAGVVFSGYLGTNIPVFVIASIILAFVFSDKKAFIPFVAYIAAFCMGFVYFQCYSEAFFLRTDKYKDLYKESLSGTVGGNIISYHTSQRFVIKTKEGINVCVTSEESDEVFPGDIVEISNPYIEKVDKDNHFFSDNVNLISDRVSYYVSTKGNLKIIGRDSSHNLKRCFYNLRKNSFYTLLKFFDYDSAAFAYSLISSDKAYISDDLYNKLVNSGLLHLCTVSGFHFSFLCMFLVLVMSMFKKAYRPRLIIIFAVISLFVLYTGFSPSVIRAYFMFLSLKICDLFFLESSSHRLSFIICACIFLVENPFLIYDASFILTFSALAGLLLFSYILGEKIITKDFFGKKYTVCALSVNMVMLPVCYSLFGTVSVWGFATNFLAEAVIALVMVFIILIVILSGIFPLFGYICAPLAEILLKYIFKLAEVPKLSVRIPFDFSVIYAILFVFVLCYLLKGLYEESGRIRFLTKCILCVLLVVVSYTSLKNDNAYIVFVGEYNGVDVIYKNSHYLICNTDDLSTSPSKLPLKLSNRIKALVIMDYTEESEENINEFKEKYPVEKIYVRKKLFSKLETELKNEVLLLSENPYNDGTIKITDNGGTEFEIYKKRFIVSPDIKYTASKVRGEKNATIFLTDYGNEKYRLLLKRLEFDKSVTPVVRAKGYNNLICTSDYSMITVKP